MGCTAITRAAPPRSRSAAPAVAVPFLPTARSRARRGGLRGPAHGGHPTHRRGRSRAALDVAPPGRLGARALRLPLLSRDDPGVPPPPQAVVEESQEAAGPGQPGAATGVHRAVPGRAGGRPTRSTSAGLWGGAAHPQGRGPRLRLGRGGPASLGCLKLAGPVRPRLLLWAVSLQRGPGANEGQVRLWPYPRANGEHTVEVLQRLRTEAPDRTLIVLWDGAPYHRAKAVREAARALDIELMSLPGYSPDLMPVEALWHWLREDVTYHHCHASAEDLTRRAADFEARINQDPC